MGSPRNGDLTLGLYNSCSRNAKDNAYCHMSRGYLERRTFRHNYLHLRVYTANDADTAMVPAIDHIGLYMDVKGNGRIDRLVQPGDRLFRAG